MMLLITFRLSTKLVWPLFRELLFQRWDHGSELFLGAIIMLLVTSDCGVASLSGKYCFSNGTVEGFKGSSAYCGGLY